MLLVLAPLVLSDSPAEVLLALIEFRREASRAEVTSYRSRPTALAPRDSEFPVHCFLNVLFSRFSRRDFKPQKLLLFGGFEIQLVVKILHVGKKMYFEASSKLQFFRFEVSPAKFGKSIFKKTRNSLLRGAGSVCYSNLRVGNSIAFVLAA